MAIEKMSLVNLVGNLVDVDKTLLCCLKSGYFHSEMSIHSTEPAHGFTTLESENPYQKLLTEIIKLSSELKVDLGEYEFNEDNIDLNDITEFIDNLNNEVSKLESQRKVIAEDISQHNQAIIQIKHLAGLNVSFDSIFACKYVKVRFGRLPAQSYEKLGYYNDKTFFFFPFDHNDEYFWGIYFAPITKIGVIDDIFSSLYFERVRIPDYAHGTPELATSNINLILDEETAKLQEIEGQLNEIKEKNIEEIKQTYCLLKFVSKTFELRKNVATLNSRFYLIGFIPKCEEENFSRFLEDIESVSCVFKPHDADPTLKPPVKLKNNKFTKPFEMFVEMYSLPSYNDIDPTSLVAITYTLLFGIMFGDLGQGLVLSLAGFLLYKFKKLALGPIMLRIGFSSAFFGLIYGSVFGYEHLLDPIYKTVFGLSKKPVEVFDTSVTNVLLIGAVGLGVLLILTSIVINIFLGFKTKNYERAIFGHNGIAGFTLYGSVVYAAISSLVLKVNVLNPIYVIGLIILPILCIFFRGPLTKLMNHRKDFMPKHFGEFIIENFFELFEYVLSYLSNSMSFLRVGGFILSHAGMMAVVMSLSEMASGAATPVVMVIGNIFVMCLEGLIVGIQVLRLEFYEIFSRNFEGNGKPFEPATVSYKIDI